MFVTISASNHRAISVRKWYAGTPMTVLVNTVIPHYSWFYFSWLHLPTLKPGPNMLNGIFQKESILNILHCSMMKFHTIPLCSRRDRPAACLAHTHCVLPSVQSCCSYLSYQINCLRISVLMFHKPAFYL